MKMLLAALFALLIPVMPAFADHQLLPPQTSLADLGAPDDIEMLPCAPGVILLIKAWDLDGKPLNGMEYVEFHDPTVEGAFLAYHFGAGDEGKLEKIVETLPGLPEKVYTSKKDLDSDETHPCVVRERLPI